MCSARLFKQKKGQIIAFVLIGLLVLIIVSFMFFVESRKQLAPMGKSFQEIMDSLQTEPVKNFIEICLRKTTVDGIKTIAANGGELQPIANFTQLDETRPLLWITERSGQTELEPEDYPGPNLIINKKSRDPEKSGPPYDYRLGRTPVDTFEKRYPFGNLNIPALCQTGGLNDLRNVTKSVAAPCPAGFYAHYSIQERLDEYITDNANKCINLTKIQEDNGFENISVRLDKPEVDVIFGEEDVSIHVDYPLDIGVEHSSREILQFSISAFARLKKVYGIAQDLARRDRTELSFDISDPKHQLRSLYLNKRDLRPGSPDESLMKIEVSCVGDCEESFDDVISIIDKGSAVKGFPMNFTFTRKNRRPVLGWAQHFDDVDRKADTFKGGAFKEFDLIFEYGQPIEFEIVAYDPDEDDIYFNPALTGWEERLSADCGGGEALEEMTAEELAENPPAEKGPVIANYASKDEFRECMEIFPVVNRIVLAAKETPGEEGVYRAEIKRITPSEATPLDFGYHKLRVEICDDNQSPKTIKDDNALCDSQEIVILIVDKIEEGASEEEQVDENAGEEGDEAEA